MKELVFHVGDRKTGSTSIQSELRLRSCVAPGVSYRYLQDGRMQNSALASATSENGRVEIRAKAFKWLARRARNVTADIGIVSSENFEDSNPRLLAQKIEEYLPAYRGKLRVIAYVRPHIDRVCSSWAERVKLGLYDGDLQSYAQRVMHNDRFLYVERFQAWSDVFGSQFTLRPMVRENLFQNCVVHDFFNYLLQGKKFELLRQPGGNESLSIQDLLMLREWHRTLSKVMKGHSVSPESIKNVRAALGRQMAIELSQLKKTGAVKPRADRALVEVMQEAYLADAQSLDEMFFVDKPMTKALEGATGKAVDEPQVFEHEAYFEPSNWKTVENFCAFSTNLALKSPKEWGRYMRSEKLAKAEVELEEMRALKKAKKMGL